MSSFTDADLDQERRADYRVLEFAGDHYAIGYQMGLRTPFRQVESWRAREVEMAFAQTCVDVVASFHPALIDEFRGYAAAQRRAWEEVLPHFSLNLPEGTLSGCTTFVWRRPQSGDLLIGRNYDFLYTQKQRYLRRLAPDGYPSSVGTQAGLISSCYDGVNSHGLFVALHLIRAQTPQDVPPGVPFHLIPRILLETCRTAREAAACVAEIPHLFPFNYLVVDAQEMIALEVYPGRVCTRLPADGKLVVTNYYQSPEMRPLHGYRNLDGQIARVRWIEAQIDQQEISPFSKEWARAQELLRDHTIPVCHHRPSQATLWSLVANSSTRRLKYCLGAPCRNEYEEITWPI